MPGKSTELKAVGALKSLLLRTCGADGKPGEENHLGLLCCL